MTVEEPRAAAASDVVIDDAHDDGFWPGMTIGFGLAALLVHIALTSLGDLEGMYRDFGTKVPLMTSVTISPLWKLAVPIVGGIALGTLIVRRPKPLWIYVAVAVACGLAAAMTWWFPMAPINELAGNIK